MPSKSKRRQRQLPSVTAGFVHKNTAKEKSDIHRKELSTLEANCNDPEAILRSLNLISKNGNLTFSSSKIDNESNIIDDNNKGTDEDGIIDSARTAELRKTLLFENLPLSNLTKKGLQKGYFVSMTDIQAQSLPYSLCKKDVLAAAKTGSGKTLSFIIPVLETLYRNNWTQMDGLGALIISPTRELALQIFKVLRTVGQYHTFSAGLLIGGKDLKEEETRVSKMNILVCTPGRLLQHMDQTANFHCDDLKMLVLDEADRILDCGFERTLNAIIDNLPSDDSRQTLLFSATQTKSIKDLARLSLSNPQFVGIYEKPKDAIPTSLIQRYLVCNLEDKIDILYSFIRTHLKSKILVFVSSCKQVQFINDMFCKLQPGTIVMSLHGKQKQQKRISIFDQFSRKQAACLICTDIAARGLDFPKVDWVIQMDCPEDIQTYIHRIGRTARYNTSGNSLLFLLPSEETGMLNEFKKGDIGDKIESILVNPSKTTSIVQNLKALCSQEPELKYLAQKSLISYVRSIYLQSNKEIFDVSKIDMDAYAKSLGLFNVPKVVFSDKSDIKNQSRKLLKLVEAMQNGDDDDVLGDDSIDVYGLKSTKLTTRVDRMFQKKNSTVLSEHYSKIRGKSIDGNEDESDDDILTLTRRDHDIDVNELVSPSENKIDLPLNHKQILKNRKKSIKQRGEGTAYIFDEEGNRVPKYAFDNLAKDEDTDALMRQHLRESARYHSDQKEQLKIQDVEDKLVAKAKSREKKINKKRKLNESNSKDDSEVEE